jgi:ribonuclease HI
MDTVTIHTDGGSRGNPGPAAVGVVIEYGAKHKEYGERIGIATNNAAEYRAVVLGLKKARLLIGKRTTAQAAVKVVLDSELVANQLSGTFKLREPELFPLFIEIWNLRQDFGSVSFTAVPREKNREADRLVNRALDGGGLV